jgi:hypothetical protein
MDDFLLDVGGEGCRDSLEVDFVGGKALGFQKKLVAVAVGEACDFVFDGGAVARADASGGFVGFWGKHRAEVQIVADNLVCRFVRVCDVTGDEVFDWTGGEKGKRLDIVVAVLGFGF